MVVFILDFETTGLNPYHNNIIECCIKVMNSEEKYEELIKIEEKLDDKIISITGITDEKLKDVGIKYNDFLSKLIIFIKSNMDKEVYFISHNGTVFDFIFLKRCLNDYIKLYGDRREILYIYNNIIYIDTLLLSKYILLNMFSYRQSSLLKYYNITNVAEHRAYGDVLSLEELFKKLCINLSFMNDKSDNYYLNNLHEIRKLLL